jgi:hypothetical protein
MHNKFVDANPEYFSVPFYILSNQNTKISGAYLKMNDSLVKVGTK